MSANAGRRRAALVALAASAGVVVGLAGAAPLPPPTGAAPCWRSIRLFDRIVISRFDHRLLAIEAYELAEARRWRDQAEADCARGAFGFGLTSIEAALQQIGVPPRPGLDELLDRARRP